ncbi:MAG TPA: diguanylate cyclase [Solirubrobacteraceae bacterium]|jgi:GGDEF domain-containing protein|nr:diguanylate cyclase [Solirubrobacteraceae bacterium]
MAASDTEISDPVSSRGPVPADVLIERMEEEIARAERQHTALSCLLVGVEDLQQIERAHGKLLSQQAVAYIGLTLRRELRRYDRVGPTNEHDYLVVLPGVDSARGEIVARRALERLRSIKVEEQDGCRALGVIAGIATWREGQTARELLVQAKTAAGRRTLERSSVSSSLPVSPLGSADALRI